MDDQLVQIAQRIRALREIAGLSTVDVAADLDIAPAQYEAYEQGAADIPVSMLYRIATHFGVDLTELLTGGGPRLGTYCLVRKGKGLRVDRRKEYDYQQLAANFRHKKAEPFLVTVHPGAKDALNSHPGQEFNYVLRGALQITIDGHQLVLEEGDALFFDAAAPHGMQALNNAPAEFLAVIL